MFVEKQLNAALESAGMPTVPALVFAMHESTWNILYSIESRQEVRELMRSDGVFIAGAELPNTRVDLENCRFLMTGWGAQRIDASLLERLPSLEAVFHAGGSVQGIVSDALFEREILVTSAADVNARPVAKFVNSMIVLALKGYWYLQREMLSTREWNFPREVSGLFEGVVGLIGYGMIGQLVAEELDSLGCKVLVYDPYVEVIHAPNVELVDFEVIAAESDVVSLHAPDNDRTNHLIDQKFLNSMKPGATLINTSRGRLVDEKGLMDVLTSRQDLTAVLDVTHPEPPSSESALYTLPNVILSPHIAGSIGAEAKLLGERAVKELALFLKGAPPMNAVNPMALRNSA